MSVSYTYLMCTGFFKTYVAVPEPILSVALSRTIVVVDAISFREDHDCDVYVLFQQ